MLTKNKLVQQQRVETLHGNRNQIWIKFSKSTDYVREIIKLITESSGGGTNFGRYIYAVLT